MNDDVNDPGRLDQLCIDTLRTLSIVAAQSANSGHPGTPMGAAPTAYCLWQRFLCRARWPGRISVSMWRTWSQPPGPSWRCMHRLNSCRT